MRIAAALMFLLMSAACSAEQPPPDTSPTEEVLVDFDPYRFVAASEETAANLIDYIENSVPEGARLIDATVRSVEEAGEPVPAEVVAAAFDRGDIAKRDFYLKMLEAVASSGAKGILDGRAVAVVSEGTAAVAMFVPDDVLIYLVGRELRPLKEIAGGLLSVNGG